MIKLTIVVPIYNAAKYLARCLNSLLCQNAKDYELLLVDDGSKDDSGKICDEYATKYEHIKVFHKENGGVSSARNLGIDEAQGEYITFIDADDFVGLNYFTTVFDYIDNKNTDLFVFNLFRERLDGRFVSKKLPIENGSYEKVELLYEYSIGFNSFINCSSTKILKTKILKENNIKFKSQMHICEDINFTLDYLERIKTFTINREALYFYARNGGSATQKRKMEYLKDYNYIFLKSLKILEKSNADKEIIDGVHELYLRKIFLNLYNLLTQKIKKEKIRKELIETELCNILLQYNFNKKLSNKLLKGKLSSFVKENWFSFYFLSFMFKLGKSMHKLLNKIFINPIRFIIRELKR